MMFRLGNLGGTLYHSDTPIFKFKYIRDCLKELTILCNDMTMYPAVMYLYGIEDSTIRRFFEDRTTPASRQGLDEDLAGSPVEYYYPERIIRYSNGNCIHDCYHLVCDNDTTCWN